MKAIMLMFDTLTRKYLPTYGCDFTKMPNFQRLQEKTIVFDEFYGGSMPCMPARRELHTGKYNFMHRSWGPLEPFDISCFETMKKNGIYTHLVTDHSHYWEDGGATYHSRYTTFEFFRGQEGDRWTPQMEASHPLNVCSFNKSNESGIQHLANRNRILDENDMSGVKTINAGIDFIEKYHDKDQWFLQIECFDPHEPFYVPDKYRKLYDCCDSKIAFNFPTYTFVEDKYTKEEINGLRKEYYALLSFCDAQLGRVLDIMDKHNLWNDTMFIVNTDHGFFLGEHDFIGKNIFPMYDEVIHLPFYIWDPRYKLKNERRHALAQTIDISPTLLNYFQIDPMKDIDGKDLSQVILNDQPIHNDILFGIHGGQINIYDGRYCLMKSCVDNTYPIYNMTLMPTHPRGFIDCNAIDQAQLVDGGRYSNGHKVLMIPTKMYQTGNQIFQDQLYDKTKDPEMESSLNAEDVKLIMENKLEKAMRSAGAPDWQFKRIGFK